MKIIRSTSLMLILAVAFHFSALAQSGDASTKFKKYVNDIVKQVKKAEAPDQKRELLNQSFDHLVGAFDRVSSMKGVSEGDKEAIGKLKANIIEKKKELNGLDGFAGVKDNQLNNFADYVQQDIEQADETITISVTVLLLIIIILLLL